MKNRLKIVLLILLMLAPMGSRVYAATNYWTDGETGAITLNSRYNNDTNYFFWRALTKDWKPNTGDPNNLTTYPVVEKNGVQSAKFYRVAKVQSWNWSQECKDDVDVKTADTRATCIINSPSYKYTTAQQAKNAALAAGCTYYTTSSYNWDERYYVYTNDKWTAVDVINTNYKYGCIERHPEDDAAETFKGIWGPWSDWIKYTDESEVPAESATQKVQTVVLYSYPIMEHRQYQAFSIVNEDINYGTYTHDEDYNWTYTPWEKYDFNNYSYYYIPAIGVCRMSNPVQTAQEVYASQMEKQVWISDEYPKARAGQSVNLAVTANGFGNASLSYQWQQSSNGSSWNNISGANSKTYQFTAPSVDTYYRVLVNGEPSKTAFLDIY